MPSLISDPTEFISRKILISYDLIIFNFQLCAKQKIALLQERSVKRDIIYYCYRLLHITFSAPFSFNSFFSKETPSKGKLERNYAPLSVVRLDFQAVNAPRAGLEAIQQPSFYAKNRIMCEGL